MRPPFVIVATLVALLVSTMAAAAPVFVDGAWLEPRLNDARVVVVDMSDDDTQYLRFHLPGALRLPYAALLKDRKLVPPGCPNAANPACARPALIKGRLDDAELAALLGRLGIARDAHVVIYDDLGGLNAARLFWELERIGHREVSLLDGGLVRWILDGRRVVNTPVKRATAGYRIDSKGRGNEAALADVEAAATQGSARLLDARSEEEYVGDRRVPRSGHVPGAQWWSWEDTVDFDRGFVRRDAQTLRTALSRAGLNDVQAPVIAYCRSGHRAARTYVALRALGYENVQLYANSMNEYALKPTAPLRQGKQP